MDLWNISHFSGFTESMFCKIDLDIWIAYFGVYIILHNFAE